MKGDSVHAGFWRRTAAFAIDFLIVGIVVLLLSLFFKDILLNLGENLWYIGFIIFGIYFVLFDGKIGKGQTIGKRFLRIRVVHEKSCLLTLSQSFFRYILIGLIIFSSGIGQSVYSLIGSYDLITTIFTVIAIFLFFGVAVMIIFNKDKRGLHDYLIKSVVIKSSKKEDISVPKLDTFAEAFANHKVAFIITIILFILICFLFVIVPKLLVNTAVPGTDYNAMMALKTDLEKNYNISNVGVQTQWNREWSNGQTVTTNDLIVSGYLKYSLFQDENIKEEKYNSINNKILGSYPEINKFDDIIIVFRSGYNLGIANLNMNENKVFLLKNITSS